MADYDDDDKDHVWDTELWAVWQQANDCGDHPVLTPDMGITDDDVRNATQLWAEGYGDRGNYDDTSSFAVGILPDGRYLWVSEWSDSSGHG